MTPLQVAIEIGNLKIVQLLLAHPNIDVNYVSISSQTFIIF